MSPEKKQEYLDYINTLRQEIENIKLMDNIPEREKEIEIYSINESINKLEKIMNDYK